MGRGVTGLAVTGATAATTGFAGKAATGATTGL